MHAPYKRKPFQLKIGPISNDTAVTLLTLTPTSAERIYVTDLRLQNEHQTTGTRVEVRDGATDVIDHGWCQQGGGGWTERYETPTALTRGRALTVKCGTTGAQVVGRVSGFIDV